MDHMAYTAASAMTLQRIERQIATNELANVSTTGFKRSYQVARDVLKAEGPGFDSRFKPTTSIYDVIDFTPGGRVVTGRDLDVAMNDLTVLGVEAPNGDLAFTRRGDLRVTSEGILETGSGHAVLGQAGPITVPQGFALNFTVDGSLFARDPNDPQADPVLVGELLLRDATDTRLARRPDGLFSPLPGEGEAPGGLEIPLTDRPLSISSGVLEASNVSSVGAMVDLLEMSRMFEMQIKLISQASSLDERGSSMLRMS